MRHTFASVLIFLALLSFGAMLSMEKASAQEKAGCYCQRYDEASKKYLAEQLDPKISKSSECTTTASRAKCRWATGKSEASGTMSETEDLKNQAESKLNQFKKFRDFPALIGQAIKLLLSFMGSILLAFYVYAGILYMTAGGNSDRIDKAKQVLVWSTLGVAVMMASYIIVTYVFNTLKSG